MSLLYYDEKMNKHEKKLDYLPIVIYLEELYNAKNETQYLVTIIAHSWYYLIEGDVNQSPVNYSWEIFHDKWKYYVDLALKNFDNHSEICFIVGYTLYLDWMYLGKQYENRGIQLMQICYEKATDEKLQALAKNFLDNCPPNKKYKRLENAEQICAKLFPSDSELDNYFRKILIK